MSPRRPCLRPTGTGGTGGRQPPPCVYAGGGSASDSDEMPPLEDVPDEEGDHFKIIATDVIRLMPLRTTFEDKVLNRQVRNWTGAVEVSRKDFCVSTTRMAMLGST